MKTRLRDASSALRTHDDGTVELVVWRRVERSIGGWNELSFRGPTVEAVEAAYDRHCCEGYDRAKRQAERRSHWGVLGTGTLK